MERRKWPRAEVSLPIRYRGVGEFNHLPLDSETKDISEGGLKFTADKFLPKDSRLIVNLNLEEFTGVKAAVRVVWVTQDSHTHLYQIGAQFDNIPLEAKSNIATLVRKKLSYS